MNKKIFIAKTADVYGNVLLGIDVGIWFGAVLRGDQNKITIGNRSNIQDLSVLHVDNEHEIVIGEDVTIGHRAIIHGCMINDRVIVGMGSTILNGANIGSDTIIGANSLITQNKSFEPGVLIMGSPAKVIRKLTSEEIKSIKHNADQYVLNKNNFLNNKFIKIEG